MLIKLFSNVWKQLGNQVAQSFNLFTGFLRKVTDFDIFSLPAS